MNKTPEIQKSVSEAQSESMIELRADVIERALEDYMGIAKKIGGRDPLPARYEIA